MTTSDTDNIFTSGQPAVKEGLPVMPCHPASKGGDVRATGEGALPPSTPNGGHARNTRAADNRYSHPKDASGRMSIKKFFRCTPEDSALIEGNAAEAGLEQSSYMRLQCIGKSQVRRHRMIRADWDELRRLLGAINRVGNLINQLVRHLHRGGIPTNSADSALEELQRAARAILRALDKG